MDVTTDINDLPFKKESLMETKTKQEWSSEVYDITHQCCIYTVLKVYGVKFLADDETIEKRLKDLPFELLVYAVNDLKNAREDLISFIKKVENIKAGPYPKPIWPEKKETYMTELMVTLDDLQWVYFKALEIKSSILERSFQPI